jgi:hypothetical protein
MKNIIKKSKEHLLVFLMMIVLIKGNIRYQIM